MLIFIALYHSKIIIIKSPFHSVENLSINEALHYSLIEDLYHINVRIKIIINFLHHIQAIVKLRKENNDSYKQSKVTAVTKWEVD